MPNDQGSNMPGGNSVVSSNKNTNIDYTNLTIGVCDVINPPFQFNPMDDIRSDSSFPHIGRMYQQRIRRNFPVVYFEVGLAKYNVNPFFLYSATHRLMGDSESLKNPQDFTNDGFEDSDLSSIKKNKNSILTSLFAKASGFLSRVFYNDRLVGFVTAGRLYTVYVSSMLFEIAFWMGIVMDKDGVLYKDLDKYLSNNMSENIEGNLYNSFTGTVKKFLTDTASTAIGIGKGGINTGKEIVKFLFNEFGKSGINGSDILNKVLGKFATTISDSLPFLEGIKYTGAYENFNIKNFIPNYGTSIVKSKYLFLTFVLERGISLSEDFSNSTTDHPVSEVLGDLRENAMKKYKQNAITMNSTDVAMAVATGGSSLGSKAAGKASKVGIQMSDAVVNGVMANISGGLGNEVSGLMSGDARFAVPQMWDDSSFDRSISLSFSLFSPYGNKLSIFENIYVPYFFLLGLTLPRQVYSSSYAQPFVVRLFSRGLFSYDMSFVSSLNVTRASDKNELTFDGFPRKIKVTMSFKEVVSSMFMGAMTTSFSNLFTRNDNMQNYLLMLSGVAPTYYQTYFSRVEAKWKKFYSGLVDYRDVRSFYGILADRIPSPVFKILNELNTKK